MKKKQIYYDKKVDAIWIKIKNGVEAYGEEVAPGMTVEYDKEGNVIGVEIFKA